MKANLHLSLKITTPIAGLLLFINTVLNAQAPGIEWQNTIGGTAIDYLDAFDITSDGGYILGSHSVSGISGDKTENTNGFYDYWVIKVNASGAIEWQNTIGGDAFDALHSIQQTSDGGYICAGISISNVSGDKTEACFGENDYWIIKLNAFGQIEWQNTIGGTSNDVPEYIAQTMDGGYIVGGSSSSGISGEKTDPSNGTVDYWILKLDASGNIEWQNSIGGSSADDFAVILQTPDSGYIVGGDSWSPLSGDKNEPSKGYNDYWILKLDDVGNIIWQKTIGGNGSDYLNAMALSADGGYILAGYSNSSISGDKTEASNGSADYWVVKTDNMGNIEWQNTIGGSDGDYLNTVIQTSDGGYVVGGNSYSDISGDKTENAIGSQDEWVLKLDSAGTIVWQNTIGGNSSDELHMVKEVPAGGYLLGGYSYSNISGDKTEPAIGEIDIWIIKLYPESDICFPPSGFTINVLPDKAKIKWDAIDNAIGYKLRYRVQDTNDWSVKYVKEREFAILKPLICNTTYEFQIMSICSPDGNNYSAFSIPDYFTTATCRTGNEVPVGELSVFPNPTTGDVNIALSGESGDAHIRIFSVNGEVVYENHIDVEESIQWIWNAEMLSNGIYQLQIIVNGNNYIEKILINK